MVSFSKVFQSTGCKRRETNIELLRILCMMGIVAHHVVWHGGGLELLWGGKALIAHLIIPAGKIGFTCFLAISMWFLCDSKFKGSRFVATWLEVLFYTVLMTVIAAFYGDEVSAGEWLGSFLPIGGISHGFAATYLVVYLLLPLLTKISENMEKRQVAWTVLILFYCQIIERLFGVFGLAIPALHPFSSEIILFIMFYFVLLYLKRWPVRIIQSKILLSVTVLLTWLICTYSTAAPIAVPGTRLAEIASMIYLINPGENGVFNIIGGIALFFLAKQIKVPYSGIINRIASCTFGILLFHDHNVCRQVFWNSIVPFGGMPAIWSMSGTNAILGLCVVTLSIFVMGCAIDLIRQKLHSKLAETDIYISVCKKMDSVWGSRL